MKTQRNITTNEQRFLFKLMEIELNQEKKELREIGAKLKQLGLLCKLFNLQIEIQYEGEKKKVKSVIAGKWCTNCENISINGITVPIKAIKEVKIL